MAHIQKAKRKLSEEDVYVEETYIFTFDGNEDKSVNSPKKS